MLANCSFQLLKLPGFNHGWCINQYPKVSRDTRLKNSNPDFTGILKDFVLSLENSGNQELGGVDCTRDLIAFLKNKPGRGVRLCVGRKMKAKL